MIQNLHIFHEHIYFLACLFAAWWRYPCSLAKRHARSWEAHLYFKRIRCQLWTKGRVRHSSRMSLWKGPCHLGTLGVSGEHDDMTWTTATWDGWTRRQQLFYGTTTTQSTCIRITRELNYHTTILLKFVGEFLWIPVHVNVVNKVGLNKTLAENRQNFM